MTGKDSDDGIAIREKDLPQKFVLKVLGHCETTGLWGLKHTREPVEKMVKFAKDHKLCLPIVQLIATREGIFVLPLDRKRNPDAEESRVKIDIDNISYGVQDLVYTRVFSMIEVTDASNRFGPARVPFVCHSFVCESHNTAKMLTYALDAAFQVSTTRGTHRKKLWLFNISCYSFAGLRENSERHEESMKRARHEPLTL
ncbi:UNVERIFIED_CONTAM: hypothetical protein PYX00_009972 [Menopon gallinae]|uniref:PID domain-containing protein n=1 Tax=Menopon gallinae TaxID=328185 RepID=A0AAW2HDL5_9NEOP